MKRQIKKVGWMVVVAVSFLMILDGYTGTAQAEKYTKDKIEKIKNWKEFCNSVPFWEKGLEVPANSVYKKLGFEPVAATQIMKKTVKKTDLDNRYHKIKNTNGWLFIDARAKKDRNVGTIRRSIDITSDYSFEAAKKKNPKLTNSDKSFSLNEFRDEKTFLTLLNKKYKFEYKKVSDIKKQIALFCNGRKCHRSTWGACRLRAMGYEPMVKIMLGGYPEWTENGLPTN